MTIKIVMPKSNTGIARTAMGTKVFNSDGTEIDNVTDIQINLGLNDVARATITVAVSDFENFTDLGSFVTTKVKPNFINRLKYLFNL